MESIEYYRLAKMESSHWWYKAIHKLVLDTCDRLYKGRTLGNPRSDLLQLLDAGCGTGGLTKKLSHCATVIGLDISFLALSLQKKEARLPLAQGSVNALPFQSGVFDIVTSISVLYHQQVDDQKALKELYRVLKKDGYIILVLPAFRWAHGSHDVAVHTKRRYALGEVRRMVSKTGFHFISGKYIFSFLFPLFLLKRAIEKVSKKAAETSDLSTPPLLLNKIFELLCLLEWHIERYIVFPLGSSLLIIARK